MEPFRDTKTFKSIFFLKTVHCACFRGDASQTRSQRHFIALDADFHCMCRSAFFPDICELSHLFIQATDTFLGGCLKLLYTLWQGQDYRGILLPSMLNLTARCILLSLFCSANRLLCFSNRLRPLLRTPGLDDSISTFHLGLTT